MARQADHPNVLLVMVPGIGIRPGDFHTEGLVSEVEQRGCPISVVIIDPDLDTYLDGSIGARLLAGITEAQLAAKPNRIWLAGISLGCQAILRCVQMRPELAEGLILLTPYLASTGLIAEVGRAGGLLSWSALDVGKAEPERALLSWLATTPLTELPRILVGRALGDRFAATATMLADVLPADDFVSVPGEHDWASWKVLWRLVLDRRPFEQPAASAL